MTPNPFDVLGLPARPDLTDEQVRDAWRAIAAATHPDREDGGGPGAVHPGLRRVRIIVTRVLVRQDPNRDLIEKQDLEARHVFDSEVAKRKDNVCTPIGDICAESVKVVFS